MRPLAVILLVASWVTASLGMAFGLTASIMLLTALLLPLLWSQQFGSWRGLLLLLLAIFVPVLAAAFWAQLETQRPELASFVVAWGLAGWMMLPTTLALLLWRRFASIPIMLLGLAVTPAASLAIFLLNPPGSPEPGGDASTVLRLFAAVTPMWFVTWACCLGPIFFLAMFAWLLYLEATRGEKAPPAVTLASPARAGDAPHNAGTLGPTGS